MAAFLRKVPEPPDDYTVKVSLELLRELDALDEAECLTPLGFHLAQLPIDPPTGKLVLLGAIFILYLSFLLGSPSMTQDHFLLKILFIGRSGVTEPYRNQI